jgi:hypothetical protein
MRIDRGAICAHGESAHSKCRETLMFLKDWYMQKSIGCAKNAREATNPIQRTKYLEDEKLWLSLAKAEVEAKTQLKIKSFPESKDELRALITQPHIILPGYSDDPVTQRRAAKYINPPCLLFGNGSNNFTLVG